MTPESIITLVSVVFACLGTIVTVTFMIGKQAHALEMLQTSFGALAAEVKEMNASHQQVAKETYGMQTWAKGVDARLEKLEERQENMSDTKFGMKHPKG